MSGNKSMHWPVDEPLVSLIHNGHTDMPFLHDTGFENC